MERLLDRRVLALVCACLGTVAGAAEITGITYTRLADTTDLRPGSTTPFAQFREIGLEGDYVKFHDIVSTGIFAFYLVKPEGSIVEASRSSRASSLDCLNDGGYSRFFTNDLVGDHILLLGTCDIEDFIVHGKETRSLWETREGSASRLSSPTNLIQSDLGPIEGMVNVIGNSDRVVIDGIVDSNAAIFELNDGGAVTLVKAGDPMPGYSLNFVDLAGSVIDLYGNYGFNGGKTPLRDNIYGAFTVVDGEMRAIADNTMPMPGSDYTFDAVSIAALDRHHTIVSGSHLINNDIFNTFDGLYSREGDAPLRRVADTATLVPGTSTAFAWLAYPSVYDGIILFSGYPEGSSYGAIYADIDGQLQRLIGPGDVLDGQLVTGTGTWRDSRHRDSFVFTATFDNGGLALYRADMHVNRAISVTIDIKPDESPNLIDSSANGVLPLAVLTTKAASDGSDFDALQINPTSLRLGPAQAAIAHSNAHAEDVDSDTDVDLVAHFPQQAIGLSCGDTELTLTGVTYAGQSFIGQDSITTEACETSSCH